MKTRKINEAANNAFSEYQQVISDKQERSVAEAHLYRALLSLARLVVNKTLRRNDEDLVVNVAGDIFLQLHTFDGRSAFSTWAGRIAHNETVDYRRREERSVGLETLSHAVIGDKPCRYAVFVSEARRRLSAEENALLDLLLEGMSATEIAELRRVTKSAIRYEIDQLTGRLEGLWHSW